MRGFFVLVLMVLGASPALACDLRSMGRPSDVAGYAERAAACLSAPPQGYSFDAGLEARFLKLVNEERRDAGLTPLQARAELGAAARFHSLDMAAGDFFGHQDRKSVV